MNRRKLMAGAAGTILALAALSAPALAQDYPNKPIKMIVPYEAGGISDLVGRIIGEKLTQYWGQQIIIDNRSGAGGTVGLEAMVREADNGYTILMGTSSEVTIGPVFSPEKAVNGETQTIAIVTGTPMVLVANKDTPYSDWASFVTAAQGAGDSLAFSSAGNGTITHVTGEAVALAAGVKLLHIPYKGGSPATMAAVAGEVPLNLATVSTALQHIQDGTVKALAVTSAQRFPALPDVPTVAELTGKDFDYSIFVHLTVPAGTDPAIIAKLNEGVAQALAEPDVKQRLSDLANVEVGLYGADAQARVDVDREKARAVIEAAHIVLE